MLPIEPAASPLTGNPVTFNVDAAAALTLMPVWLPVKFDVSVAVTDCVPAVLSVTGNVCLPESPVVNV